MRDDVQDVAAELSRLVEAGDGPRGSLRMFGEWFGRPGDNVHRCVGVESDGDCLVLRFDQGETLRVWQPVGVEATPRGGLRVASAARVRWEWFPYGSARRAENLSRREHAASPGRLAVELG